MKHTDWNEVKASEDFEQLPAGGYICGITSVEDFPAKEYLKFEFDIAGGDYKNYYRDIYNRKNIWLASFVKSYKESCLGYFKKMLEAFAASNKGFEVNSDDEQRMKRKYIGLVLGYEEYMGKDKNGMPKIKQRICVDKILPVGDIQNGNFEIPELKRLNEDKPPLPSVKGSSMDVIEDDDDLPWN